MTDEPSTLAHTANVRDLLPDRSDWEAVRRRPRADLLAGLTVAVVALPLALAFGASSGLGAGAGVITAVVAGLAAAIFGGSNLQVSGPTGAMTVVLIPVVHEHGRNGVLMVGLLAGVMLLVMAFLRVGGYVRFLPVPVIEGFTAGIAVVIGLQQIPFALGVSGGEHEQVWATAFAAFRTWVQSPLWMSAGISIVVALVLIVGMHRWPKIPLSLGIVVLVTGIAEFLNLPIDRIGALPTGLPAPSLAFISFGDLGKLVVPALAVAALAALESLLCATVADGMTQGERHDPDRELFGQGVANLVVPLFGGVPATAAIARTAVNVRAGARSKLASASHAIILLLFVSLLAPLVGRIPLAALAGVLLATAFHMVEVSSLLALTRGTRGDGAVLALTFFVTVAFDLVTAVCVGVAVAIVLALRQVARTAKVEEVPPTRGDTSDAEHELLRKHVAVFRFDGPLFFAAAQRFLPQLADETDLRVVVLRLSHVTTLDATGAHALEEIVRGLERRGKTVMISGIAPSHDDILGRLGVLTHLRADRRIHRHTAEAIARALELVSETADSD